MRNDMSNKGEECFKEILSRDSNHIETLLVYGGLICTTRESFEEARTYIETAVQLEPDFVIANIFLALLYETMGEESASEKYLADAKRLHEAEHGQGKPKCVLRIYSFISK